MDISVWYVFFHAYCICIPKSSHQQCTQQLITFNPTAVPKYAFYLKSRIDISNSPSMLFIIRCSISHGDALHLPNAHEPVICIWPLNDPSVCQIHLFLEIYYSYHKGYGQSEIHCNMIYSMGLFYYTFNHTLPRMIYKNIQSMWGNV